MGGRRRGGFSRACLPSEGLLTYVTYVTYVTCVTCVAMAEHLGVGAWAASLLARGGETLAQEDRDFARNAEAVRERLRSSPSKITE